MANKTDIAKLPRYRVQYACNPKLQVLIALANSTPPLHQWAEFVMPIRPITLLSSLPVSDEKIFKWQEEQSVIGWKLLHWAEKSFDPNAYFFICKLSELEQVALLEDDNAASQTNFLSIYNDYRETKNKPLRDKAFSAAKVYKEKKKNYWEASASLSEIWFMRYRRLKYIKQILTRLVFVGRDFGNAKRNLNDIFFGDFDSLFFDFYIDEFGITQKKDNPLVSSLVGIDVKRLRTCVICKNFFWATRNDKQCCGKQCANRHNQRISRERKQENKEIYSKSRKIKKLRQIS